MIQLQRMTSEKIMNVSSLQTFKAGDHVRRVTSIYEGTQLPAEYRIDSRIGETFWVVYNRGDDAFLELLTVPDDGLTHHPIGARVTVHPDRLRADFVLVETPAS